MLSELLLRITLLRFDESAMSELNKSATQPSDRAEIASQDTAAVKPPAEIGGRGGLEPTRYGDWEKNGRCIDF
ncbi:MAG: DUF1674 domain-containing protein [Rudaea sp.]|nr:DUF1674 domain-containing protein [Rudaea sp.]